MHFLALEVIRVGRFLLFLMSGFCVGLVWGRGRGRGRERWGEYDGLRGYMVLCM